MWHDISYNNVIDEGREYITRKIGRECESLATSNWLDCFVVPPRDKGLRDFCRNRHTE